MNLRNILASFILLVAFVASLCAGLIVYLFATYLTTRLSLLLPAALLVVAIIFGIGIWLACRIAQSTNCARNAGMAGVGGALIPVLILGGLEWHDTRIRAMPPADAELVAKLESGSVAVRHGPEGINDSALTRIDNALSDSRIVVLGEATHGTSEFFEIKHRIFRHLVEHADFRHFVMEVHPERTAPVLNQYVQGEDVDPTSVLYWPWGSEEYLELLHWMRTFNRHRPLNRRIVFHGMDPVIEDRDRGMAENVIRIEESVGADEGIIVWAANSHVHATAGGMGQYLREHFGDAVYLLGLEFHGGRFTSRAGVVHTYEVDPFPSSYFSEALMRLPGDARFIDFRAHAPESRIGQWLQEPRFTNAMYELYAVTRLLPSQILYLSHRVWVPATERFDGLLVVRRSSPPQDMVPGTFPPDTFCEYSGQGWASSATGLWYQRSGSGPVVVLIHGAGLDSRMWNDDLAELAQNHTVVRYDLRGFGRTEPANAETSHMKDLGALMDELEIDSAHLVGHSLGGGVALAYALENPERVRSVTAVAPAIAGQPFPPEAGEPYHDALSAWREGRFKDAVVAWLDAPAVKLYAGAASATASCVGDMVHDNLDAALHPLEALHAPIPATWQSLESLNIPVLLLVGDMDVRYLRDNAAAAESRLPLATMRELEGGIGHLVNFDAPDAFRGELRAFLEETE